MVERVEGGIDLEWTTGDGGGELSSKEPRSELQGALNCFWAGGAP